MMTSSRPYMLRAIYEWIVDNNHVPHIVVNALHPGVVVPQAFVNDGRIVLNISPSAVRRLELKNTYVAFEARFSGQPMQVYIPMAAVLGIVDRETGQGLMFLDEGADVEYGEQGISRPSSRPNLRAVDAGETTGSSIKQTANSEPEGDGDDEPPPPKRPGLRIVR